MVRILIAAAALAVATEATGESRDTRLAQAAPPTPAVVPQGSTHPPEGGVTGAAGGAFGPGANGAVGPAGAKQGGPPPYGAGTSTEKAPGYGGAPPAPAGGNIAPAPNGATGSAP